MKYRLKSDHSVTCEATPGELGGLKCWSIRYRDQRIGSADDAFMATWEPVPENTAEDHPKMDLEKTVRDLITRVEVLESRVTTSMLFG